MDQIPMHTKKKKTIKTQIGKTNDRVYRMSKIKKEATT